MMKIGSDPDSQLFLNGLERSVLSAVGTRLGPAGDILRVQFEQARVVSRTYSGVGFVTRLEVPEDVPALPEPAAGQAGAIYASHPELAEPAEFLVQIKAGRLASIEAFCFTGLWPADDSAFRVGAAPAH